MELKGSKTEKNLKAAFAGESQAHNRYSYFADVARKEGMPQIARLFQEAAEHEKQHALRELTLLKAIGNTPSNLETAAKGEHDEWTNIYPEFERIARHEGFPEIADFFKGVARAEEEHERKYLELLKATNENQGSKKDDSVKWKCTNCGWIGDSMNPPDDCPTCKAPNSGMEALSGPYSGPYQNY